MSEKPWYCEGLRFRCTGCGSCCVGEPGYVWVNKAEIEALAAAVGLDVEKFERKYIRLVGIRKSLVERTGGDCALFDRQTRKCRVYDVRPRQCRTWPFWKSNLDSAETWAETADECPGCGRGPVISLSTIESRVKRMKV